MTNKRYEDLRTKARMGLHTPKEYEQIKREERRRIKLAKRKAERIVLRRINQWQKRSQNWLWKPLFADGSLGHAVRRLRERGIIRFDRKRDGYMTLKVLRPCN